AVTAFARTDTPNGGSQFPPSLRIENLDGGLVSELNAVTVQRLIRLARDEVAELAIVALGQARGIRKRHISQMRLVHRPPFPGGPEAIYDNGLCETGRDIDE